MRILLQCKYDSSLLKTCVHWRCVLAKLSAIATRDCHVTLTTTVLALATLGGGAAQQKNKSFYQCNGLFFEASVSASRQDGGPFVFSFKKKKINGFVFFYGGGNIRSHVLGGNEREGLVEGE